MARMSIDDMLGRDPRITRLANTVGWSKRELVGALVLDVWPLCYDRKKAVLSDEDVDTVAGKPGFAQAMIDSGLAKRAGAGKVRIAGAQDRIEYLLKKQEAGKLGGLKSGESRGISAKQTRSKPEASAKQTRSKPEAPGNPIATASASASAAPSASAPALVPDPEPESAELPLPRAGAHARGLRPAGDALRAIAQQAPEGPQGADETRGAGGVPQTAKDAATGTLVPFPGMPATEHELERRRRIGNAGWDRLNRARAEMGRDFGWEDVRPLHPQDPGRAELAHRLRESGSRDEENLDHVLTVAIAEARTKGTVEYLTGGIFGAKSWAKKLGMRVADAESSKQQAGFDPFRKADEVVAKMKRGAP